ncbi:MAG TPA: glycosyltransferase family A protein [Gaiellaceae bacterium]
MTAPRVSVVVVTRNRKREVLRAVESCLAQSERPEVLVMVDGATDDTPAEIGAAFPAVQVHAFEETGGQALRRNQGFSRAQAPIVVSLDDDAALDDEHTLRLTLADFSHERIAAVAMPIVDVGRPPGPYSHPAPRGSELVVPRLMEGAVAVRKDCFLAAGGFPARYFGWGEGNELCLRLLALGYVVKLGSAPPVLHRPSLVRNLDRMDYYGRRNDLLFGWTTLPASELPLHLGRCAVRTVRLAGGQRRFRHHLSGTLAGITDCVRHRRDRRPVSSATARLDRALLARKRVPLEEVLAGLDVVGGEHCAA